MPKLSLIMPAYNAEKTCIRAIESVVNNDFDLELIIVDDGSTDKTYDKCKAIQENDGRVKVYRKSNGGVSTARNFGLNIASGEYIGFIDSDDLLAANYMETLFPIMKKQPDFILFGYSNLFKGSRVSALNPANTENIEIMFDNLLFLSGGLNSPWNKLFKHSLLHHTFNIEKSMGEDLEFCCNYLKKIKTCVAIPDELYLYNMDTDNSLTKRLNTVLESITSDMIVLSEFVRSIGRSEKIIDDKFFQRTEGVLGGICDYKEFCKAVNHLINDKEYVEFLYRGMPQKYKNRLLQNMLINKKVKCLYGYLFFKRYARSVLRK